MICPDRDVEEQKTEEKTEDDDRRIVWKSCCLRLDKDFAMFATKYFIIIGLITFFSVELHLSSECEDKNLYQSLLLLLIGVALPSPQMK